MRGVLLVTLAALVLAEPLDARAQATRSTGQIEGDIYLVTGSGDVKMGAALEVALIPQSLDIVARWETICDMQQRESEQIAKAGTAAMEKLKPAEQEAFIMRSIETFLAGATARARKRAVVLRTAALATSPTGAKGHYRFDRVPTGEYFLFAEMTLRDELTWWIVPVRVAAGGQTLDLDNTNALPEVPLCTAPTPFPVT